MRKKLLVLTVLTTIMLNGCQTAQDTSVVSKTAETTTQTSTAETTMLETTVQETTQPAKTASLSKMDELGYDITIEEFIMAFQEDYVRAAETAGITADHNNLEYEVTEEDMLMIPLDDGLQLIMNKASDMKMVWYAGYPASDEAFLQEMQIVLMAGDNTLTQEEAKTYAEGIWKEGWENRNNLPSAVQKKLPSGVLYTFSTNDRHLISFQIVYKANN